MIKLFNVSDVDGFLNAINRCKGNVKLVSQEGDVINLKSKLCQYVALANIFAGDVADIPELHIEADEPDDVQTLMKFASEEKR